MNRELLNTRPAPSTPYERMIWQQQNCRENIIGYAVGLAAPRTERAAYLAANGQLTNSEREAAVLPKQEASDLMDSLYKATKPEDWLRPYLYKIAFLVPVSNDLPLDMCTFCGH